MAEPRRFPFEGNYAVTLPIAITALVPFIIVTAAFPLFRPELQRELHATAVDLDTINDLATGGYAFGALAGGDMIQRFRQRDLFLTSIAVLAAGATLCAGAHATLGFGLGYVGLGLMTGLLLVVALPPVIQQFPARKLPVTAAAIDVGFFGGVTLGPPVGGLVAAGDAWRALFALLAVFAAAVFAVASATLPRADPRNPHVHFDWPAIALGLGATALTFWGVGRLAAAGFGGAAFVAPFAAGCICFVALLLLEYREREPLSPVKPMWNTMPVIGVLVAMTGGGAYFALFVLAAEFLTHVQRLDALATGLLFWPQIAGALLSSLALGIVLRTRWLPVFALAGMCCVLCGGALLLVTVASGTLHAFAFAALLLGFGAGASVAPGLWFASLSLQSKLVGRIFALVELIRSLANFLFAPIVLALAVAMSGGGSAASPAGIVPAIVVTLAVTVVLILIGIALFALGGVGLQRPDLERWNTGEEPAWTSPELLAPLRRRHPDQQRSARASRGRGG